MGGKVLMRLSGSNLLTNSWKQELVITEDGVHGEILKNLKRVKMFVPFDRVAQVNLVHGILTADLEVINKGGTDNLIIRALNKQQAEQAKALIEEKVRATSVGNLRQSSPPLFLADEWTSRCNGGY